jgi:hypothetical protein
MPIAIRCRRAPRSADFVIAENLDWLYTAVLPLDNRGSKPCARRTP